MNAKDPFETPCWISRTVLKLKSLLNVSKPVETPLPGGGAGGERMDEDEAAQFKAFMEQQRVLEEAKIVRTLAAHLATPVYPSSRRFEPPPLELKPD